jgi:predicted lipoprotein with Yx(FWY)xxD motif
MKPRTSPIPRGRRRAAYAAVSLVAGFGGVGAAALAGLASAKSPTTLGIAKNVPVKSNTENVVVNGHGVTVYTLSGDTARHLECTRANTCFQFWFPVRASSARAKLTAANGIKGKLGKLHRNGFYQVTLGGHPLYTFLGDAAKQRHATGEGIASFGGTWHVIAVKSSVKSTTTMTSTTTTTPYTTPTYTYP